LLHWRSGWGSGGGTPVRAGKKLAPVEIGIKVVQVRLA